MRTKQTQLVLHLLHRSPLSHCVRPNKMPLLMVAVKWGTAADVSTLIRRGANVNGGDMNGKTALMAAAEANDVVLVQQIIAAGATLDATQTLEIESILAVATAHRRFQVVTELVDDDGWKTRPIHALFWQPPLAEVHNSDSYAFRQFPTAYTLLELRYMNVLSAVLAKSAWPAKLATDAVRAKWMAESGLAPGECALLTAELRHLATGYIAKGYWSGTAHGVFVSDALVGSALLANLQAQIAPLEAAAEARGDFHPHSQQQVLDVVHPSLYCAVYGRTKCARAAGAIVGDRVLSWQQLARRREDVSSTFQWLPTPVTVDGTGAVTFRSYVNNLPPAHTELTGSLEALMGRMLPLFEAALATKATVPNMRVPHKSSFRFTKKAHAQQVYTAETGTSDYDSDAFDDFFAALYPGDGSGPEPPVCIPPLATTFVPPPPTPVVPLLNRDLHVIVKIATIRLTPAAPTYAGGAWHVEGMENESIVATGILYYDVDNITESRLGFRQVLDAEDAFSFWNHDETGLESVYGVRNGESLNVQDTGFVAAVPGRIVVFPNFLQHRVDGFELRDPTRAGERKIVAFFLVNPSHAVISTAHVPPQQAEWATAALTAALGLPTLVAQTIGAFGGAMSHAEARENMEALMGERKQSQVFARHHVHKVSLW
ncbi:hypothetical protein ACHHYP_17091 [Achlya hypogyna]|uniref:DUF4246 domain-containing protein n=1 Tax=Achlya hypogyna TaxID=1202772 RepID=A0A1V9Y589_ACHHY|nr:hypothetical protein ACHHYP_17091 [Achlya hypogyna]